jgi:hypothetical protein
VKKGLPKSLQTPEAEAWRLAAAKAEMSTLYAESGGDTTRCEICDAPLDNSEPWKRGLDGAGAHIECLRPYLESA